MKLSRSVSGFQTVFNSTQLEYCKEITRKMMSLPISQIFNVPVDTTFYTDYLTKIKHPMDFSKVLDRLNSNFYTGFVQWKDDVMQIFSNAKHYNAENTFPYLYAKELETVFLEKISHIPSTEYEAWLMKLEKHQDRLNKMIHSQPGYQTTIPKEDHFQITRATSKSKIR